ncbi:MAG: undecaprenyl-diphosphate phosphatase [Gaiellales bacterium]
MLSAAFWGLVQGLTEFLPISSSGHLVLIPALLGVDEPDLASSAMLHVGTLLAVLWFYRADFRGLVEHPVSPHSKRIWMLLAVGTVPAAVVGLTLDGPIEVIFSEPAFVAVALIATGLILALSMAFPPGERAVEDGTAGDAVIVGLAQALALIPGISRSGTTITAGLVQGLSRLEAARYAFLLGAPAIAGAGLLEGIDLIDRGGFQPSLLVGVAVAAVTGYLAIGGLVRLLSRRGLAPFAIYCVVVGTVALVLV